MKKLLLFFGLLVFTGASALFAQVRVITGTVTSSAEGEGAIPGVTIQVKGTTIGALSDVSGRYAINVPTNATTLVFSYIGMKTQEVEIGNRSEINVVLESDLVGLDEVVVTAMGVSRERKSLGYSVQDVSSDDIVRSGNTNFAVALQGKVAGLDI
ncbi:MAG: SusC/RagA family TonB-linked outer membrane protein, partial [Clostridiaceae bacterium]|nr:SusC/RagA family TonB-linked outer membrane protein [Clostridiaceae bacterium]